MSDAKTVVAAALGECVHVAGVMNFLRLAEAAGLADGLPGAGGRRSSACCEAAAGERRRPGRRLLPPDAGDGRAAAGRVCRGRR